MFGLTTTRRCMAEQTKIYTLGKAYGYVDALKELSRNIQVETDVRRSENSDPVNGKYWEGWTLESFVKWLEGETIRMMRSKEISSTEFMDQIVRATTSDGQDRPQHGTSGIAAPSRIEYLAAETGSIQHYEPDLRCARTEGTPRSVDSS